MSDHTGRFNPYLPLDTCIPDGEPKLFGDRVYVYGSKDEFEDRWCSYNYHVYSAPVDDLTDWTDHGVSFASRRDGLTPDAPEERAVPWCGGLLWAPDIAEKDGKYYLYFCQEDDSEGVAEADTPYGPFVNARRITMNGEPIHGIDPSVLNDNGTYWYTWGQGHCHLARLMDDMCTLDPSTYVESIISHDDGCEGFHEGSSLRKIGDTYCMVYASEYTDAYPNRGGAPTHLDYAVSEKIEGPYVRKGVIVDNTGIDPASWNDHGSILKVKDQWYVFYHGSSGNKQYGRRARAERIEVDEETVTIKQTEMTSSGFAEALDPTDTIPAAVFYKVTSGANLVKKNDAYVITEVTDGVEISWRYFDFSKMPACTLTVHGSIYAEGKITAYANGTEVGSADVHTVMPCGGLSSDIACNLRLPMTDVKIPLANLPARADLTLKFEAANGTAPDKLIMEPETLLFC